MLHRLWEQIGDLVFLAIVSLTFGVVKILTLPLPKSWRESVGSLILSVILGTLAGALALQHGVGDYTAITISSVTSLLSRDIVLGILQNRQYIGNSLRRGFNQLIDKFTKAQ